jgi:hypothetical protein
MATARLNESTGEGGGQGYAYWAGRASVTGPHIFTGSGLSTASESDFIGGIGGQASNSYVGSDGNNGLIRYRWPLNSSGVVNTIPSSGPIKFSDIAKLGRLPGQSSISLGNYYSGSDFLPTGRVLGGTPPTRFLPDGVTVAPKTISALRNLYIEGYSSDPTDTSQITIPAYVRYIALRLVGASGGGGGGDGTIAAGSGGRPVSLDGVYDLNSVSIALNKTMNYQVGEKGVGGGKATLDSRGVGGIAGLGGDGGKSGNSGQSGGGGGGGGYTRLAIAEVLGIIFIAGGGGGGGGAGRLVNAVNKDGNSIGIGGEIIPGSNFPGGTLSEDPTLIRGNDGQDYGVGDGGGCGGGGGFFGQGGQYAEPESGSDTGGYSPSDPG